MPYLEDKYLPNLKLFPLTILLSIFLCEVHAQVAPVYHFTDLIDDGQCTTTTTVGASCQTFASTCSGGWIPANGTPELLPVTGWHCAAPCTQGTAYCDPVPKMSILMVGSGTDGQGHPAGEGVYKNFYFQSGFTYELCAFFSFSGSGGTIGLLNFAMANGLTPYTFSGNSCQSAAPLTNAKVVGAANSNTSGTYYDVIFTATSNYSQVLVYTTAPAGGSYTAILTGLNIIMKPTGCATPSIVGVSGGVGQASVTFTTVPGVQLYQFNFINPVSGANIYSVDIIGSSNVYDPTSGVPYPTRYTQTLHPPAGTYKVTVQTYGDGSCSSGVGPPSTPSNTITVN